LANLLTRTLARLFRDRASVTPLSRLKREGIRTVSVLDLSDLEDLVEQAIHRAIRSSAPTSPLGRELAGHIQAELLSLLGKREDLERTNLLLKEEQELLAKNHAQLEQSLTQARQELEGTVREHDRELLEDLTRRIHADLDEILDPVQQEVERMDPAAARLVRTLKPRLRETVFDLLCRALRESSAGESSEKVDVLRQRIAKLTDNLQGAHQMMERLRESRDLEEQGIPSLYREVQGLTGREDNYVERRQLMKQIFQLNLDLKDSIGQETPKNGG